MRCILHIDMDAFFAAVEQRDHPELRGKPVVVGAPPDQRGVVSTCSYEARVFGIHSAMPSREAYRRCPEAVFLSPNMARYETASRHVFEIFERFSPLIEPVSIDEAFVDVTGARMLFGDGAEIAKKIRAMIREEVGLAASVGVAKNKFLAKLGSEKAKPDGLFIVPGEQAAVIAFLGAMPIDALWGIGKINGERLIRSGFRKVADLQKADPDVLERLMGKATAMQMIALANGADFREVEVDQTEKSISREYTFLTDCRDREQIRDVLKGLVDEVGRRVREHGYSVLTGRVKLRWSDFKTITRQAQFEVPVCDDFSFRGMALKLFDAEELIQPVRLIGFGVSGFSKGHPAQLTLFDATLENREKHERLCHAVDALRRRFGTEAVRRIGVES